MLAPLSAAKDSVGKFLRFISRLTTAFVMRHFRFLFASFISGFLLFFFLAWTTPYVLPYFTYEVKTIGIVGNFTPSTLPYSIQRLIGLGLTEIAENGEPKPAISSRWEINENGKVYTFYLRNDLVWHDGKKFTAYDVNYNINGVDFRVRDDHTFEASLKDPFTPLPVLLSRPLFRKNLNGLGSYKVTALELNGDTVKFMKLKPLVSSLPELALRFYSTENNARTAFKLGEVSILEDQTTIGDLSEWKNVKIEERIDHTHYVALFYNTKHEMLTSKTIRQGLNFAVPKLENDSATGPISPLSWAYSNKVRQYKFDLDAAKRILGKEGLATSSATLTLSTFPSYLPVAKRIAESWQTLGLSIDIKIESSVPDDFQALLGSQEIPPDPDQYPYWHSTQETNISKLDNKRIDVLLERGRKEISQSERLKIYSDFQRYLAEEAPAAFLFYPKVYTIRRT